MSLRSRLKLFVLLTVGFATNVALFQNCSSSVLLSGSGGSTGTSTSSSSSVAKLPSANADGNGSGYNGMVVSFNQTVAGGGTCPGTSSAVQARIQVTLSKFSYPVSAVQVVADCAPVARALAIGSDISISSDLRSLQLLNGAGAGAYVADSASLGLLGSSGVHLACHQEASGSAPQIDLAVVSTSAAQVDVAISGPGLDTLESGWLPVNQQSGNWVYGNTAADPGHYLQLAEVAASSGNSFNFRLSMQDQTQPALAASDQVQSGKINCYSP